MSVHAVPSPIDPGEGTAARSRTHTWSDPLAAARDGRGAPGSSTCAASPAASSRRRRSPRRWASSSSRSSRGRAVFGLPAHEFLFNPIGSVHGGALATLIDSAASCAVHSVLDAGVAYATTDLHVTYVRAFGAGAGRATCTGELLHAGRRLATATARVLDDEGRLLAHGTVTCAVLAPVG